MKDNPDHNRSSATPVNFIRTQVEEDLPQYPRIVTRFPPEPNGYLHVGHAKSICLNFGVAEDYNGQCNLRFDDTNPVKEDAEYVDSIRDVVKWLGFDWHEGLYYASDYFERLYELAQELIRRDRAYVDDLNAEEIRAWRGTLTLPGRESPWRGRPPEESLELFARMRAGDFPDGSRVLRAKIDMHSPNLNMRDPVIYRIRRAGHHRTGDAWCIYPMYDYAHCLSDALEGVSHSLCTLEFEDHRPLYDWVLEALDWPAPRPRQIEFARLNLEFTLTSKRKLLQLVREGRVEGWDDPRMPTIVGLRRRGYTPEAIRAFCERIGVAKRDSWIEYEWLEQSIRDDLNPKARRVMGVLDPLPVVIDNYPEGRSEELDVPYFPDDPGRGQSRPVPFSREIYIERGDFMEEPSKKFFRLAPGREVRLRFAYYITCREAVKDREGRIIRLHCTYDPASRGGDSPDGRKIRGTIHWVSAAHALRARARLYERLFTAPRPDGLEDLNPDSLRETDAWLEPSLAAAEAGEYFQFERQGYFIADAKLSRPGAPLFNRIVSLRDSWAKMVRDGKV
ncbi:MAG: glutamine--tRNA ligase/YqeY domain fusion protein [Desulfarculales bacterium]|nr:glutamine--tRNA ligase/YqeY domain fusion protein [Desulfarculales bacterium]